MTSKAEKPTSDNRNDSDDEATSLKAKRMGRLKDIESANAVGCAAKASEIVTKWADKLSSSNPDAKKELDEAFALLERTTEIIRSMSRGTIYLEALTFHTNNIKKLLSSNGCASLAARFDSKDTVTRIMMKDAVVQLLAKNSHANLFKQEESPNEQDTFAMILKSRKVITSSGGNLVPVSTSLINAFLSIIKAYHTDKAKKNKLTDTYVYDLVNALHAKNRFDGIDMGILPYAGDESYITGVEGPEAWNGDTAPVAKFADNGSVNCVVIWKKALKTLFELVLQILSDTQGGRIVRIQSDGQKTDIPKEQVFITKTYTIGGVAIENPLFALIDSSMRLTYTIPARTNSHETVHHMADIISVAGEDGGKATIYSMLKRNPFLDFFVLTKYANSSMRDISSLMATHRKNVKGRMLPKGYE